jgi:hypothetical protein
MSERLTDKTNRTLLGYFHAEGARGVRLVTVAVNGNVIFFVEFIVCSAVVLTLWVLS